MTLDQDVAFLRRLSMFADFSDEQLRLIAFSAEPLNLPEGTVLFREGAAADSGYAVVVGTVRLSSQGPDGPVERGIAGPGALIGEMALLCPTTRPVTAETAAPTQLLSISRRLLRRVLEEYPEMAAGLQRTLTARLERLRAELSRTREALLGEDLRDEE